MMVSTHYEPSRIWPIVLAQQAFSQTYGIWIFGLLAVVLVTAKFQDAIFRKSPRKVQPDEIGDKFKLTEVSINTSHRSADSEVDCCGLTNQQIDSEKCQFIEFFCVLRSTGFSLKRVKDKKTSAKCIRVNSQIELTWSKKYHFGLGSSSCRFPMNDLVSAFLCEGENCPVKTSQFILQFRNKILCFEAATREAAVYIVNGFDNLRIRFQSDSYLYSRLNEYYKRRSLVSNTPNLGASNEDDVSVQTSTTYSSISQKKIGTTVWQKSNPLSIHRRRESIIVIPM